MLSYVSDSRASDAAFRALADAADAAAGLGSWLIVGGHMVNLHVLRTGSDLPLRATRDADLAVELLTLKTGPLLERLAVLGYRNTNRANRFDRQDNGAVASIDLLVPSYTMSHEPNLDAGSIAVDGIPMLHLALARAPMVVHVDATLTDGTMLPVPVNVPDVVSAIAIKTFAYSQRFARRDAEDLGRLLEVAHLDGLGAGSWPDRPSFTAAARKLSFFFDVPGEALPSVTASPAQRARIRALVRAMVGRPGARR